MKLLLDTHVVLWWLSTPEKLSDESRRAIANPRHLVFVSAASLWEISIKEAVGKLKHDEPIENALAACRFFELPVNFTHATALRSLPSIHKDPFDRMLIAQAINEGLTIVSRDAVFTNYQIQVLAA